MFGFRKELPFKCATCGKPLGLYIQKTRAGKLAVYPSGRTQDEDGKIVFSRNCRKCGTKNIFSNESSMLDIDAWKIEFKKKQPKRSSRTYSTPLYLHCIHCKKDLKVKFIISGNEKKLSRGKIQHLENRTKLTVVCPHNKCSKKTVFVRDGPEIEKYGWTIFRPEKKKSEPRPLRPLLYEVDKTAAIIEAEKSRKRKHRRI